MKKLLTLEELAQFVLGVFFFTIEICMVVVSNFNTFAGFKYDRLSH